MKKLVLTLFVLFCFAIPSSARMVIGSGGIAASCPADGSPDVSYTNKVSHSTFSNAAATMYGGTFYTPASDVQICKVAFCFARNDGDVTNKQFVAKIWTTTGNNLNAVITNGTSSNITSAGWWSDTEEIFQFTGNPSLTGTIKYAITINKVEGNGSPYGDFYYGASATATLLVARWDSTGVLASDWSVEGYEPYIKLYYYD